MNEQKLRELDEWIAVHVFGWHQFREEEYPYRTLWREGESGSRVWNEADWYTTDPVAAMMVLEKCAESELKRNFDGVQVDKISNGWLVSTCEYDANAVTLPMAICLFARKLFEK